MIQFLKKSNSLRLDKIDFILTNFKKFGPLKKNKNNNKLFVDVSATVFYFFQDFIETI